LMVQNRLELTIVLRRLLMTYKFVFSKNTKIKKDI